MNEEHPVIIQGKNAAYAAPENFCRAIFLQLAVRVQRQRSGVNGRQLSRFFARQAEAAFAGAGGFELWKSDECDFANAQKRDLMLRAMKEVVESIHASAVAPENWNACPRWRDWGIVKARELLTFLVNESGPIVPPQPGSWHPDPDTISTTE